MKNILKLLSLLLLPLLLVNACREDADRNWTSPEPSFKLHDTTLGSNVLYPTMENNPFVLSWDDAVSGSGSYTVYLSSTADFKSKVELGKSETNSLKSSIGALNKAMLKAGLNPYSSETAYLRVERGTEVSNTVTFAVTTYPEDGPMIVNPAAGSSLVLDENAPDATATTIKWNDYTKYGVKVTYLVEMAAANSDVYFPLGTVENAKELALTNLALDQAVLKTGAVANVASDVKIRVTATSSSIGGTIVKTSDVVTFKVTPYQLESFMYVPGAYQNWDPATAVAIRSATSNGVYVGYINFTAPNSAFKITPERNWTNNYGSTGGNNLTYNGGNDLVAPNVGWQKLTVNLTEMTYDLTPYSWGIIGSASPGGWDDDTDMVFNSTTQKWEIENIALTVGEIKFRLNNAWTVDYGDNGNDGTLERGAANIPITEAGNYKITFDEENQLWTKTKL